MSCDIVVVIGFVGVLLKLLIPELLHKHALQEAFSCLLMNSEQQRTTR